MKREVVITDDGSSSIFIPEMDESYHSSHGAIQEARHVFIKHGLEDLNCDKIKVFEVGFGTGLNALLSYEYATASKVSIHYSSIEAYPVEIELINQLNYTDLIDGLDNNTALKMHESEWGVECSVGTNFELLKINSKLEEYIIPQKSFDIVFFDAFGPRAQSEMWQVELLQKMYDGLVDGGVLVTYCAQGQFKRNLKSLGFKVESLPGPPGKREMTKAIKI